MLITNSRVDWHDEKYYHHQAYTMYSVCCICVHIYIYSTELPILCRNYRNCLISKRCTLDRSHRQAFQLSCRPTTIGYPKSPYLPCPKYSLLLKTKKRNHLISDFNFADCFAISNESSCTAVYGKIRGRIQHWILIHEKLIFK